MARTLLKESESTIVARLDLAKVGQKQRVQKQWYIQV
jgi:hypothetical protein